MACYKMIVKKTIPGIVKSRNLFKAKSEKFKDFAEIGRTHLMDATPFTFCQEFSGYTSHFKSIRQYIRSFK